jgi:hypothetical protein
MAKRGEPEVVDTSSFHSRKRAKQLIDFKGMKFNKKVRPTDLDAFNGETLSASIDFDRGKKGFVFYEVKYLDNGLDIGQVLHLEALCDNLKTPSLALHVSHDVEDTSKDVLLKDCIVKNAFYQGKWRVDWNGKTALEITQRFIEKHCPEYLLGD